MARLHKCISLCLLLSFSLAHAQSDTHRQKVTSVTLDSPVLNTLDGSPFIHIGNMMYMGKQLVSMLSKQPCLYFSLDGQYYTIRGLSELEQEYADQGALSEHVQHAFDDALRQALDEFVRISQPYVEEIKAAKQYMTRLIQNWSEKRDRAHTYLLAWADFDDNEEEALYQGIRSIGELKTFVDDLSTFLFDLIRNCPRSYEQFKQQHQ